MYGAYLSSCAFTSASTSPPPSKAFSPAPLLLQSTALGLSGSRQLRRSMSLNLKIAWWASMAAPLRSDLMTLPPLPTTAQLLNRLLMSLSGMGRSNGTLSYWKPVSLLRTVVLTGHVMPLANTQGRAGAVSMANPGSVWAMARSFPGLARHSHGWTMQLASSCSSEVLVADSSAPWASALHHEFRKPTDLRSSSRASSIALATLSRFCTSLCASLSLAAGGASEPRLLPPSFRLEV
mmetsp:Transcript_35668/g.100971  ORF Transcript_35668/g.100971 Transcript_35668/m.100971 type:complete len:236 (-) Transcript_35668:855-1562(-)